VRSEAAIKRVRADTLGYLQRSFLGCVSEVDQREARAAGQKAAECAAGRIDRLGWAPTRRAPRRQRDDCAAARPEGAVSRGI